MTGSRGSHGEGPTSRRATQADGILLATPKQQADPGDWRSRGQLEPATPSTSPSYWSDDDTEPGVKPTDLYGKFTWKIENFSEISKRELRSNVFEVGNFKWYILVYPHGCDVCNHLSLFLCVADYDKLLPGWSHFAQFTIAVVNKDPKKSKYSDTLHRFCKKEHDWGWKKFMELSKVMDGFTVADTLVIKAQVQVIKEAIGRPFRCLDSQYRRELVRVYLTNVEGICRRFVEEKREKLSKLVEDEVRFASFRAFWGGIKESQRKSLSCEKTDTILKSVVKKFFNEKEVTSTLVMDALFSGTKSLERTYKVRAGQEEWATPTVWLDKENFVLSADVLTVLDRAVHEPIPAYKDDKGSGTPHRVKVRCPQEVGLDDMGRDSVERDERRLQELGRRTVEMFVLSHLFSNRVEVAYREAIALKRQEELIREEEEAEKQAAEKVEKDSADKEKKQSKKQKAKQRKKDRQQREEDEKRARLELEQRTKKEKEVERRAARNAVPPAPVAEDDDTESDEESDEDDEDDGEMSEEEEPETLGEEEEDENEGEEHEDGEEEDDKPGPAHVEEEEEDEWQEAEPAFRPPVTVDAPAVTVGRSRRRRNKKRKGVESNEVVGGAGPLPVPVVGVVKVGDDASSTASGESGVTGKGAGSGGAGGLQDVEKQSEEQDRRPSAGPATSPDMDGSELEERVASAGAAGAPSSSGADDYDSHEAEAIIASLRERVSWLEDRLREKEDEVVVLQEQLRQQALPNGLPSAPPLTRPSSALSRTSSTATSDAARVGPVFAAFAPKGQQNGPPSASTGPGVRGVITPPQQAAARGGTAYGRPADPRLSGGRPSTPGSAREEPPSAASAAAAAAAAALSRPTSAPSAGPLLRHISGPVPNVASPPGDAPQLARSLSGSVRSASEKPPGEVSATPLAPSYRNAAAGKIRGGTPAPTAPPPSSAAPPPSSLAAFPPIGQPPQISTQQGGSSRSSASQPSPPLTPSSQQESPSSGPTTSGKSSLGQEQAAAKEQVQPGGGVPGKRGAVYAPPMHAANPESAPTGGNESGSAPEVESAQPDGKSIKFGSVTADVLPPRSPRAGPPVSAPGGQDQQAQHRGVQQRAPQQAVGRTPPHTVRSSAGGGQPNMDSPGLSEDFPHLSLINDLLDDDLLGMGGALANGNDAGRNPQGGYSSVHSQIPPQLLARKLHPGASPFSPASATNRTEGERGGGSAGGNKTPANGLSHHQQKPQQQPPQQGPPQHHYQQHQGNNNVGSSGMGGNGQHKNGPPEYVSAGGMQRAQQLRHTRSLPPGAADGLLSNGHMGHPQMYWMPSSGGYPPPGMHGVNGPMLDKNGLQGGVPPGYQMPHGNYGQYAQAQQPLPSQHQ